MQNVHHAPKFSLDWAYINSIPTSTAVFKQNPEDFQVTEFFDTQFSGQGEHILLKVEKKGLTTEELVQCISKAIHKSIKLISYAGLKDRQALTTQWISVHAPGEEIAGIGSLSGIGWRVLEHTRHHKKLKPGFLTGNRFKIILREVSDLDDFIRRLERIKSTGVPNYFGEQRFGHHQGNLIKAEAMLVQGNKVKDRFLKGMYFSAARSWIFNKILSRRVQEKTWNIALASDVMQLSGSSSIFTLDAVDAEIIKRIKEKDLAPASPLPGKRKTPTKHYLEFIHEIYQEWQPWIAGLEQQGLEESWRSNILHLEQVDYLVTNQQIELSFLLPAGAFATVVLRELVCY